LQRTLAGDQMPLDLFNDGAPAASDGDEDESLDDLLALELVAAAG
jgi:hypothetical protein